jgi:hypothetical protein
MTFWIIIACSILPLWFLQNVIHELAHGLTVKIGWGWDFSIYPFPSNKLGRFTFAHVKYTNNENSKVIPEKGFGLVSAMPKIVNIVLIVLSALFIAIFYNNVYVVAPLIVFTWCNYIDFTVGMLSIFKANKTKSDIWRIQKHLNVDVKFLQILSAFSVAGFGLYSVAMTVGNLLTI